MSHTRAGKGLPGLIVDKTALTHEHRNNKVLDFGLQRAGKDAPLHPMTKVA